MLPHTHTQTNKDKDKRQNTYCMFFITIITYPKLLPLFLTAVGTQFDW